MKQVLHIFKKDVRHFWPQIALSLAIVVGYARFVTTEWRPANDLHELWVRTYLAITAMLVPVGWWALLGRSILDERLVGDRQFWTTRPYEWKKLLSAKVLFAFVFIIVPLFVVQLGLLASAGFAPLRYLSDLCSNNVLLMTMCLLPVAALATVTSTLGQLLLMLVVMAIYVIAVAVWTQPSASSLAGGLADWLTAPLVVIAGVIAVLWQYSGRRTARSRWLLAGCAATLPLILWSLPYETLAARNFPALTQGIPAPMQVGLSAPPPSSEHGRDDSGEEVSIDFPMNASGVPEGSAVALKGSRVSLEAQGFHWASEWQASFGLFLAGSKRFHTTINMKRSAYEQMKTGPVKVRVDYAIAVYRYGAMREVPVSTSDFSVPELGICRLFGATATGFQCRAPLGHAAFLATFDNAASTCAPRPQEQTPVGKVYEWSLGTDTFGFSPVEAFSVNFYNDFYQPKPANPRLCSGSPVTFTELLAQRRLSIALEADGVKLEDYRSDGASHVGFTSFGWSVR